jgi:hypothetical protein
MAKVFRDGGSGASAVSWTNPVADPRGTWKSPMDPKPRPNHKIYLQILSRMTAEQKLQRVFELSDLAKSLFREGLRERFPDAAEEELHRIYLERLEKCHNRNY